MTLMNALLMMSVLQLQSVSTPWVLSNATAWKDSLKITASVSMSMNVCQTHVIKMPSAKTP